MKYCQTEIIIHSMTAAEHPLLKRLVCDPNFVRTVHECKVTISWEALWDKFLWKSKWFRMFEGNHRMGLISFKRSTSKSSNYTRKNCFSAINVLAGNPYILAVEKCRFMLIYVTCRLLRFSVDFTVFRVVNSFEVFFIINNYRVWYSA